ncbi:hypothetical protein [Undibacterium sp.]|jgi:hypothetical protein|uniref:hypothetical protein n=1 Tax=Undibacterium sp. TaxID=1914977 RepID=UPI002BB22B75|nr:hypothetical protein [Undibacterium sp.]HTD05193.1 hypothetical protein [Undibacterium sp.]
MTINAEHVSEIFSVFHDGTIVGQAFDGSLLDLEVEIIYLAVRVNPNFRSFRLRLLNTRDIRFKVWPNDVNAEPYEILSVPQIFQPELEILRGKSDGDAVKVICSQVSKGFDYCGGELSLRASSAVVTDESGIEYSICDLKKLSEEYWADWERRNAVAK